MEYWNKTIVLENLIKDGIITLDRGRVISSIDLMKYPGDYPVYSSSAQKNGYFGSFDLYDFDEELITWSVDGGGYFFYRPKHKFSVTNVSGIMRITKSDKYDYKFLYYLLAYQHKNQIFDYVDKAHPSVIKKRYFIPEIDKSVQTQIATILSKVDEAITQTEQLIAKYTRIKTGLMQDLLTKGIDENGNIRSEETHEFKDSPLGRIPKEWGIVKLIDIGSKPSPYLKTGPFGSSLKSEHWKETGVPVITIGSLGESTFIKENLLYVSEDKASELNTYKLNIGDILFSRVADIGRSLVIQSDNNGWIMSSNFMRLRLNKAKYNPFILNLIIKYSEAFLRQVAQNVPESGRSVTNSKILNSFIFPNIPMPEQEKVMVLYSKIDSQIDSIIKQLSKLQSLKTGLMQDLLSGKVRVNHLIKETASL